MDKNNYAIASLAMDLKRVALAYYNGSTQTADSFYKEALKRKEEIDEKNIKPYLQNYLKKINNLLDSNDRNRIAEDALMYSTIFLNYVALKK